MQPDIDTSFENVESTDSQHSVEFKMSLKHQMTGWERLLTENVAELVDLIGTLIVRVGLHELFALRPQLPQIIDKIIMFRLELPQNAVRYAFCANENPQYLIQKYANAREGQPIHRRFEYNDEGSVSRDITIEKVQIGSEYFALKTDTRNDWNQQRLNESCERFYHWFQLSRHKNILSLSSAQIERGSSLKLKMMFPFIEGERLDVIINKGELSSGGKLKIAQQMVHAVEALHSNHLIHGDIKIQNFMCSETSHVTLIDMDSLSSPLSNSSVDYTYLYVGPHRVPSFEADLWALGLCLYKLETNQKLMPKWNYHEYRTRDTALLQYINGYGQFDEVIRGCLHSQPYLISLNPKS